MCSLQSTYKILFRNLIHLAFNHHDVVLSGTNHKVHIGFFHLFEGWIDDILTINASHTNL